MSKQTDNIITKTEYTLLKLLSQSLCPSAPADDLLSRDSAEWDQILALADRHEVLSLLENILVDANLTEEQKLLTEMKSARTIHEGIRLQALNGRLTALLEQEGIRAVTLKGCAVARYYPVPEFRKTTDVDLFVADEKEAERAALILCANGFRTVENEKAKHHVVLISGKGDIVELHSAWADDFQESHLNQALKRMQKESAFHIQEESCNGIQFFAYETAWKAFYLVIHMLQHFVGTGFGLRNLCDWVVLWENCEDAKVREEFWKMVCESGTAEFVKAMTAVCVRYLGLSEEKSPVPGKLRAGEKLTDALLRDILNAGEFGYSEAQRMVGMDGDSPGAYVRLFQQQMHENFPGAGRCFLLWPVLWILTLLRFLKNNKKLERGSVAGIMKKAGERGALVKRLMP